MKRGVLAGLDLTASLRTDIAYILDRSLTNDARVKYLFPNWDSIHMSRILYEIEIFVAFKSIIERETMLWLEKSTS